jgi:hypothetical protein
MKLKPQFIGIGLVLLTWLAFFSPIISGREMYFLDDLKAIYYPMETIYAQFQHSFQLPVWSNAFGFGQPLLAWGQLGFFTPVHVLLRALYVPPLMLLQASVVIYFLIGSVGMYAFLRKRLFSTLSSSLGAILFAYCGFSIGHLNHVNFYTSTMLLPLLLLTIHYFLIKPSLPKTATLALVAAAIAMSGQPQVVAYVYAVAGIVGLAMFIPTIKNNLKKSGKKIVLTMLAGLVGLCLSSLAILPLQEFVPNTERAAGLPYTELFEFSYPPYETITLIFPYFFGDHANYHGPKGFQELAAYTGVIPLILAGMALVSWKNKRPERSAGIFLAVIGATLALGRYSVVYQYLINNHYITTVGVVGRFVFFFDIGIVLLAVIGLEDLLNYQKNNLKNISKIVFGYIIFALLVILPFWIYASYTPDAQARIAELLSWHGAPFWIVVVGILTIPFSVTTRIYWAIPMITSVTLLAYGWSYNPRISAALASVPSPFIQDLKAFKTNNNNIPARIYAAEHLPVTGNPNVKFTLSDYISPTFTVFQPLIITKGELSCLTLPIQADAPNNSRVDVMIRSGFSGQIWYQTSVVASDAFKNTNQHICFPPISSSNNDNLMLSVSSGESTSMKVFVTPSVSPASNLYFVRVQKPSEKQLQESLKPLNIKYTPEYPTTSDLDSALMIRHDQALAGASSATWIGALSIQSYRNFVDGFLANDADSPFDGDGIHALTRNKSLVDMAGITHFTQSLDYGQTNDPMVDAGYPVITTADTGNQKVRLYQNKDAYPKAFMVPTAKFIAADDDTRAQMRDQAFNPKELVYISGPTPPDLTDNDQKIAMQGTAKIINYTDTRVDIQVDTNKTAYLVLADATLPEWQTTIDGKPALQLKADTVFKAAQVPAGSHVVSFIYNSPAVNKAVVLTEIGVIVTIAMYAYGLRKNKKK